MTAAEQVGGRNRDGARGCFQRPTLPEPAYLYGCDIVADNEVRCPAGRTRIGSRPDGALDGSGVLLDADGRRFGDRGVTDARCGW